MAAVLIDYKLMSLPEQKAQNKKRNNSRISCTQLRMLRAATAQSCTPHTFDLFRFVFSHSSIPVWTSAT